MGVVHLSVFSMISAEKSQTLQNTVPSIIQARSEEKVICIGPIGGISIVEMATVSITKVTETAILFDKIYVSAGVRGTMLGVDPNALAEYIGAKFADVTAME